MKPHRPSNPRRAVRETGARARSAARAAAVALTVAASCAAWPAVAQQPAPSALDMSSDKPVHIEADVLEVFDDKGIAVFTGNVVAVQEGTTLNTTKLTVFYAGGAMGRGAGQSEEPAQQQPPQGEDDQRIKRLEAEGKVVVTTAEQKATGDKAVFLMETNSVTLTGDVVLTQGENVLRGTELVVDLDTGRSKLVSNDDSGAPSRVSGMFKPGSARQPDQPAAQ